MPNGRFIKAEEIGAAVAWLLLAASAAVFFGHALVIEQQFDSDLAINDDTENENPPGPRARQVPEAIFAVR